MFFLGKDYNVLPSKDCLYLEIYLDYKVTTNLDNNN